MKSAGGLLTRCPDPRCAGNLSPQTNGNGGLKDVCDKCHRTPATVQRAIQGSAATAAEQPGAAKTAGKACTVEGCPGRFDTSGICQCCARRSKWEDEHAPKRSCTICGGEIRAPRKRCTPCAKLFTKISQQVKKEPAVA